uniref:Adrenoceptor alpha 2A n=1 Tax=Latimeria chalumnae TaxID=7897 RepID=H3B3T7_LATCH
RKQFNVQLRESGSRKKDIFFNGVSTAVISFPPLIPMKKETEFTRLPKREQECLQRKRQGQKTMKQEMK